MGALMEANLSKAMSRRVQCQLIMEIEKASSDAEYDAITEELCRVRRAARTRIVQFHRSRPS